MSSSRESNLSARVNESKDDRRLCEKTYRHSEDDLVNKCNNRCSVQAENKRSPNSFSNNSLCKKEGKLNTAISGNSTTSSSEMSDDSSIKTKGINSNDKNNEECVCPNDDFGMYWDSSTEVLKHEKHIRSENIGKKSRSISKSSNESKSESDLRKQR